LQDGCFFEGWKLPVQFFLLMNYWMIFSKSYAGIYIARLPCFTSCWG